MISAQFQVEGAGALGVTEGVGDELGDDQKDAVSVRGLGRGSDLGSMVEEGAGGVACGCGGLTGARHGLIEYGCGH